MAQDKGTLGSAWRRLSQKKRSGVFKWIAGLFLTSFALGYAYGWYESPTYSSASAAERYAASNFRWVETSDDIVLRVRSGNWIYTYSTRSDSVAEQALDPQTISASTPPRRRRYVEEAQLLTIAGATAVPGGLAATASTGAVGKLPPRLRT